MNRRVHCIALGVALSTAACTSTPMKLGRIEPVAAGVVGRPVQGEACGFQLMAFIPIGVLDRNERAYQQMVEAARGEVVADIHMQERWSFAVVGWQSCTLMTGTAYPRSRG